MLRDTLEALRDLGVRGTAFRAMWEVRNRTAVGAWRETPPLRPAVADHRLDWVGRVPIADPVSVADVMRDRIGGDALAAVLRQAQRACHGHIVCFGHMELDYGDPIDWQLNPMTGERWRDDQHWTRSLRDEARVGDVKLTWEVGRFPHAYLMARAAAFFDNDSEALAHGFAAQVRAFVQANPFGKGAHWGSGQEEVIRLIAWIFAARVLLQRHPATAAALTAIREHALDTVAHLQHTIDYARLVVTNNHLIAEALGMYLVGIMFGGEDAKAAHVRDRGRELLTAAALHQFYTDGGYVQQAHNYHRAAMQMMLWALQFARMCGERPPDSWLYALERSLDFLVAQQNPSDGRLPNYGANDGSNPSILSCSPFPDFRPVLQATSVAVRGERLYDAGPWDEHTAWFFGPAALDLPLRPPKRTSVSFPVSGHNVLRSDHPGSFATLRCGPIVDRFTQMDMLHVDIWWRGENVMVDGGSFAYNAADAWHNHFTRTGSHNTLSVDGAQQMVHHRRFVLLYRPRAKLLRFDVHDDRGVMSGEHYGYERISPGLVHRRSVLSVGGSLWVVVDWLLGTGEHTARLHWLTGTDDVVTIPGGARLRTRSGDFDVALFNLTRERGLLTLSPASYDVGVGNARDVRGWLSRSYMQRQPVASLVARQRCACPGGFVSVLGPNVVVDNVSAATDTVTFRVAQGETETRVRIKDGFVDVER